MRLDEQKIAVEPDIEVSSVWAYPDEFSASKSPALILAHGAGSDMRNAFLSFMHESLPARGIMTVKFNFPYTETGRKAPDPPQRLMNTWRSVIKRVRAEA